MHSSDIIDSEYNVSHQTFFPWFSMDPLKNKNKTLTHGGVPYARYDRDIIYDGVCACVCNHIYFYIKNLLRIMVFRDESIRDTLTFLSSLYRVIHLSHIFSKLDKFL